MKKLSQLFLRRLWGVILLTPNLFTSQCNFSLFTSRLLFYLFFIIVVAISHFLFYLSFFGHTEEWGCDISFLSRFSVSVIFSDSVCIKVSARWIKNTPLLALTRPYTPFLLIRREVHILWTRCFSIELRKPMSLNSKYLRNYPVSFKSQRFVFFLLISQLADDKLLCRLF